MASRKAGPSRLRILIGAVVALAMLATMQPGLGVSGTAAAASVPAFPGAEGHGATTPGGRGGRVIEVTNLNDSGAGSLRAAIQASGPRIIVFRVGGTINLQSPLEITNPYVTIAGQTAPGQGITLKSSPTAGDYTVKLKDAHDVVIRYLRVRSGPAGSLVARDGIAFLGSGTYNVVLDHVSVSWATDEDVSFSNGAHAITIQQSIVSEGLNESTHPEGAHSMGMLITNASKDITVHHTIFAHNNRRSPRFQLGSTGEFINNLVYNWGIYATHVEGDASISTGATRANVIGNLYIKGPNDMGVKEVKLTSDTGSGPRVYLRDNYGPNRQRDADPQTALMAGTASWVVSSPAVTPSGVTEDTLREATLDAFRSKMLGEAGATRGLNADGTWYARRDAVDKRVTAEIAQAGRFAGSAGKWIDSPWISTLPDFTPKVYLTAADYTKYGIYDPIMTESGFAGWPRLDPGTPYADSDHDGMPDVWEKLYGLNPNDPGDANGDADGDGYTNVEEFLNGTKPTTGAPAPTSTPTPKPVGTATPAPTSTPVAINTPAPTSTPVATNTPAPTSTPAPTNPPALTAGNLLDNPGFEAANNGAPTGWSRDSHFTRTSETVHSGSYSGKHSASDNASYEVRQDAQNLTPGKSYSLAGWVNIPATNDDFSFTVVLRWYDAKGNTLHTDTVKQFKSSTNGWTRVAGTYVAPTGTSYAKVRMQVNSLKGSIFVDDFSLQ